MSTNKENNLNKDINEKIVETVPSVSVDAVAVSEDAPVQDSGSNKFIPGKRMRNDNSKRNNSRGKSPRGESRERVKPEFDSKIIDIRRVTRVATGGRRYSFSVAVVAGDRKGRVGVGLGKAGDTALAVEKATREAKKNLIKVNLSSKMTIPHAVEGKYSSAKIKIFPARGSGVVAGSSARSIIELAGIKDVCAKYMSGSKNRLNNAKATIEALKQISKLSRKALHVKVSEIVK